MRRRRVNLPQVIWKPGARLRWVVDEKLYEQAQMAVNRDRLQHEDIQETFPWITQEEVELFRHLRMAAQGLGRPSKTRRVVPPWASPQLCRGFIFHLHSSFVSSLHNGDKDDKRYQYPMLAFYAFTLGRPTFFSMLAHWYINRLLSESLRVDPDTDTSVPFVNVTNLIESMGCSPKTGWDRIRLYDPDYSYPKIRRKTVVSFAFAASVLSLQQLHYWQRGPHPSEYLAGFLFYELRDSSKRSTTPTATSRRKVGSEQLPTSN
jgi:hypothetical protein